MSNRRSFIKDLGKGMLVFGGGYFPTDLLAARPHTSLTILHTNDVHSRIDPFPMDGGKYQGLGGAARRAAIINNIRSQEKNVLLLDSGDMLQGTPFFNFFDGEVEFQLMNSLKYDAVTLGNHDFDCGIEQLSNLLDKANFSTLCSNYNFQNTPLENSTKDFKIFEVENVKIGVFGVGIKLDGLVPKKLYKETEFVDPILQANKISKMLKSDFACDFVICLSHLGFEYEDKNKFSDVALAHSSQGIDLILGGHTHTFLDEPRLVKNRKNKWVMINQVGWAGIRLGRIDLHFEKGSLRKKLRPEQIIIR